MDTCCTGQSGSFHDLLKPGLRVREGRHVLKATVGERSPVVALAGREPAEDARETVVVVVPSESCQGGFGVSEAVETFAAEDLRLEDVPQASILPLVQGEEICVRRC